LKTATSRPPQPPSDDPAGPSRTRLRQLLTLYAAAVLVVPVVAAVLVPSSDSAVGVWWMVTLHAVALPITVLLVVGTVAPRLTERLGMPGMVNPDEREKHIDAVAYRVAYMFLFAGGVVAAVVTASMWPLSLVLLGHGIWAGTRWFLNMRR
jgi:hypothetical protein